jgi:hypothetical protein
MPWITMVGSSADPDCRLQAQLSTIHTIILTILQTSPHSLASSPYPIPSSLSRPLRAFLQSCFESAVAGPAELHCSSFRLQPEERISSTNKEDVAGGRRIFLLPHLLLESPPPVLKSPPPQARGSVRSFHCSRNIVSEYIAASQTRNLQFQPHETGKLAPKPR